MIYPRVIKDLLRFNYESDRFKEYNDLFYRFGLFRYFMLWRTLERQDDSVKFRLPWISFPAIKYLEKFLDRRMKVFEYGCGGSTLFFADRVGTVISAEHDRAWYEKLSGIIKNSDESSVKINFIPPAAGNGDNEIYFSGNELYSGLSFKEYVSLIDSFPENYFDVILIDGRARNGCFLHSISRLRKGGLIVWDNSERERYRDFFSSDNKGLKRLEFPGPTPFSRYFTQTTIFIK
jgi:hypothetical protein